MNPTKKTGGSLEIQSFSFSYPAQTAFALHELSLQVSPGEFITICGKSGSGKTTLLRHLKPVLAPAGKTSGEILLDGAPLSQLDDRTQSAKIGFVLQSPDHQLVTDKVWHELAFGLESLGLDTETIRLRVAEMASFFGIQTWFYQDVSELSGGQKQLLNLASVMAMQPEILILDEPTSQLDPIAAADFLETVSKINRELGTTILLTEHRLEEALPHSDRLIVMDAGEILADGTPAAVGALLREKNHEMFLAMPAPMRIYAATDSSLPCPVTVREGRTWLRAYADEHPLLPLPPAPVFEGDGVEAITLTGVHYRYAEKGDDVVRGLDLHIPSGAFYAIVGGNGTGKTTTLSLISGLLHPDRGTVALFGRPSAEIPDRDKFGGLLGVLPQNPQALFVKKTVLLDLEEMLTESRLTREERAARVQRAAALCELEPLLYQHPYDLSGGEQQRAALAKVLLLEPRILLLDEPTKGLDSSFKEKLSQILKTLQKAGTTIVMVSHDVEFCAKYADACAMFFDGAIVAEGPPRRFFSGNSFYTTAANRMCRSLLPEAVTAEDVIRACGGTAPSIAPEPRKPAAAAPVEAQQPTLKKSRKAAGIVLAVLSLIVAVYVVKGMPGARLLRALNLQWRYAIGMILATTIGLLGAVLLTKRVSPEIRVPKVPRRLSKRTLAAAFLILLLIPLTLFVGSYYLENRKYYFISLLVVLETMIPFFLVFEGRKPKARELVVIATLCAIAVAGRAAFFFVPQFKPVAALVILSAVAFGGETGFLVGAVSMLVSNLFFGQGPWTPFQMFAMGIIGFLGGVLFRKGFLRHSRAALCAYGGLSVLLIYGVIMNTYSVFQYQEHVTLSMIFASCAVGIPLDLIHALSTVLFLWVAGPAMLEKLERLQIKYELVA